MKYDKNMTLRVNKAWQDTLERLLEDHLHKSSVRDRSELIRDLVTREAQLWQYSPYVATKTMCFVFVAADGDLFYWINQSLLLIEARRLLPTGISIKPEKLNQFVDQREDPDRNWLMNCFSVWRGEPSNENLIVQDVDRCGITSKFVDLFIHQSQDTIIFREILVAVRDYVQRTKAGVQGTIDDRADLPIDIPTLELEMHVIVDLDLYRDEFRRRDAAVDYEIRNRELARLLENRLGPSDTSILWDNGRHPPWSSRPRASYISLREEVQRMFGSLLDRIEQLTNPDELAKCDDRPMVVNKENRTKLRSLKLPEEYIFGRLQWHMPYPNLVVSTAWNMPEERR